MRDQVFRDRWVPILTIVNIASHFAIGVLLTLGFFRKTFLIYGLGLAVLVLAVYTGYSELALFNLLGRSPCSCIGWLENQGWLGVFITNAVLLFIALMALIIILKERRIRKKKT
nr:MauE/DoxX family redox-associated membrane protein [Parapedobacter tibetensis]